MSKVRYSLRNRRRAMLDYRNGLFSKMRLPVVQTLCAARKQWRSVSVFEREMTLLRAASAPKTEPAT